MHIASPTVQLSSCVCNRPLGAGHWGQCFLHAAHTAVVAAFRLLFSELLHRRLGVGRASDSFVLVPVLWPETTPTLCRCTFGMHTLMPTSTPQCSLFFVLHYRIWFNLDNISFIYVACDTQVFLITSEPAPKAQRHRQLPAAFIRVFPYQCVLLNVGVGASSRSRNHAALQPTFQQQHSAQQQQQRCNSCLHARRMARVPLWPASPGSGILDSCRWRM